MHKFWTQFYIFCSMIIINEREREIFWLCTPWSVGSNKGTAVAERNVGTKMPIVSLYLELCSLEGL